MSVPVKFRKGDIKLLLTDISRKLRAPVGYTKFWSCFAFVILFGGALGVWTSLYQCKQLGHWDWANLSTSLYTFFPAIVTTALFDLYDEDESYLRFFGVIASVIFMVIFFFSITTQPFTGTVVSLLGALMAIMFWWITNGEKEWSSKKGDQENPPPVGGDPATNLSGQIPSDWKIDK